MRTRSIFFNLAPYIFLLSVGVLWIKDFCEVHWIILSVKYTFPSQWITHLWIIFSTRKQVKSLQLLEGAGQMRAECFNLPLEWTNVWFVFIPRPLRTCVGPQSSTEGVDERCLCKMEISKAFDTSDQSILQDKLTSIIGPTLGWIESK